MIATSNNTGKSVTVLGHLSALPSSSTNVFDCHFGDQVTKGRTISEAAGGVLKCDVPNPPLYSSMIRFGVSAPSNSDDIVWDEDAFRWNSIPFPMSMSSSVVDARGGAEIQIRGVNLTRANTAWNVRFGNRTSRGISDIGRGAIVTMTPPLDPGVWQVRIGDSDDVWYDVPGRLVVVDPVRLFMIETEKNVVELIYAAVGMHEHDLKDDLIQAEALVEGYPNIPLMRKSDGDWYAKIHVYNNRNDLVVSCVRLTYANDTIPYLSSGKVDTLNNPSVLLDNNFGKGWHWHRRNEEWFETSENALKGGELWNELGGVQVRFEGHGGITGISENSSIAVSENEIVINTKTPTTLKEYDGVTIVRVSLDRSRFTNEDTTPQHVFDTRYELDNNITTYLRISPTTSAFAGQSIAFNTVSRKRFDERVVYVVFERDV